MQEATVSSRSLIKLSRIENRIIDILRKHDGHASAGDIRTALGKRCDIFMLYKHLEKLRIYGLVSQCGVMVSLLVNASTSTYH